MNAEFIDDQLGPGIVIAQIQPADSDAIEVSEHHRAYRAILQVRANEYAVRGTYRRRPPDGHRVRLFIRRDTIFYPQAPINFRHDRDNLLWECPSAWFRTSPEWTDNEIVIAELSEDLQVATRHYSDVHAHLGQ